MDKEKEIEGMADLIGHNKYVRTNEQVACILFDEGYRFADEVRKETAKEILQDVKSTLAILMVHGEYCDDWNCGKVIEFIDKVINPVETKYGVEVDE